MRVLVNPFDEAEKLGMERGNWVVGVLETRIFWPTKKQTIHYDGKLFLLLPVEKHEAQLSSGTQPAIALNASAYNLSPELGAKSCCGSQVLFRGERARRSKLWDGLAASSLGRTAS